jgi:putative chitinase
MIDLAHLQRIVPLAGSRAAKFIEPLNAAMLEFEIFTPKRQAAFIAQIAHESGSFFYVRELASGAAYDTGRLAERLGNTPEDDGDGEFYRGRGLIQITGHRNYLLCGLALDLDLLAHPELLEQPVPACRSAAWFWHNNGLNDLADRYEFQRITKRINGGLNGQAERLAFYETALRVLA